MQHDNSTPDGDNDRLRMPETAKLSQHTELVIRHAAEVQRLALLTAGVVKSLTKNDLFIQLARLFSFAERLEMVAGVLLTDLKAFARDRGERP